MQKGPGALCDRSRTSLSASGGAMFPPQVLPIRAPNRSRRIVMRFLVPSVALMRVNCLAYALTRSPSSSPLYLRLVRIKSLITSLGMRIPRGSFTQGSRPLLTQRRTVSLLTLSSPATSSTVSILASGSRLSMR